MILCLKQELQISGENMNNYACQVMLITNETAWRQMPKPKWKEWFAQLGGIGIFQLCQKLCRASYIQ